MKIILGIKFYFFLLSGKIRVGGFVNQLIKKFWPNVELHCFNDRLCRDT